MTEEDLGIEWGSSSEAPDASGDTQTAPAVEPPHPKPVPPSDDPAPSSAPASASTQTRIERLSALQMQRNVDEAVELAVKMLDLGLVPKSVKVGTAEIHFAAYEKPRAEVEPSEPTAPRPNRYEAARSRMAKGTR